MATRRVVICMLISAVLFTTLTCTKPATNMTPAPASTTPASATLSREEQLVAAAKNEGKVAFWAAQADQVQKFLPKFKERYPWLEVEAWKDTAQAYSEKIINEAKAGKTTADVLMFGEEDIKLLPTELMAKYEYPNMAHLAGVLPTGSLYLRYTMMYHAPAYNTNLVPPADVPKSWDDLKNPKWKGKAAASLAAIDAPLVLAALLGRDGQLDWDKSFSFWEEVFRNTEPKPVQGYTGPTNLLGAGEYQLINFVSGPTVTTAKVSGKLPVDLAPFTRISGKYTCLTILKNAPHPSAARLLVDFMTSVEGSTAFNDAFFMVSPNPQVTSIANTMMKEKGVEIVPVTNFITDENVTKSQQFWVGKLGVK